MGRRPKSRIQGLSVVRGPQKDTANVWYWRLRVGRAGAKTLWSGWATKADAERTAHGVLSAPELTQVASSGQPRTVRELLRVWGRVQRERVVDPHHPAGPLSSAAARAYRCAARRLVRSIGSVALAVLGARELRRHKEASTSPQTAKLDFQVLHAAWRWAHSLGHVAVRDLPIPAIEIPDDIAYIPPLSDVVQVLEHLTGWHRLAVEILAVSGLRIGELSTARWGGLVDGVLTIDGKTGVRAVPLPLALVQRLETLRGGPTEYVLGVRPGAVVGGRNRVGHRLRVACERAGVQPFAPGALRRLASSRLLEAGVAPLTYERIMGHSFAVAKKHYAKTSLKARQDAVVHLQLPAGRVLQFPSAREGGTNG